MHDRTCTVWPRATSAGATLPTYAPIPSVIGGYSLETNRIRTRSGLAVDAPRVGHLDRARRREVRDGERPLAERPLDAERRDLRPLREHAVPGLAVDIAEHLVQARTQRQLLDPAAALPFEPDAFGRVAVMQHRALHEQAGATVADADVDVRPAQLALALEAQP